MECVFGVLHTTPTHVVTIPVLTHARAAVKVHFIERYYRSRRCKLKIVERSVVRVCVQYPRIQGARSFGN
jgi:hypothetical protein